MPLGGGGKSQLDDQQRIIGATVTNNPYIGHLIIVRMANGDIEAINLTMWKYQADAQAKVSSAVVSPEDCHCAPPSTMLPSHTMLIHFLPLLFSEQALERRTSRGAGSDSVLVNSLQPFDELIEPEIENLRLLYEGQHLLLWWHLFALLR